MAEIVLLQALQQLPDWPETVTLQAITDNDSDFLFAVYASTRADEVAQLPQWSEAQRQAFLQQQFAAQHAYYQTQFALANFCLICRHDEAIGRLYLERRRDEIRLIDIALLPSQRGNGVGGALLHCLLQLAQQLELPVRIHVEKQNPAMRLYRRLGFVRLEDKGVYDLMHWQPAAVSSNCSANGIR